MSDATIASVPLYTNLDRIANELAARGIGPSDPIPPEQLFAIDQWHYHGTDAIRAAADHLLLGPASRVLDVGSGVGGPARYLAHVTGCHVTALELQPNLNALAVDLTRRCGLGERVTHRCGDALTCSLPEAAFDAAVSWLAILHIPDRPRLLRRLARSLRPGAGCYIEDLAQRAPFSDRDLRDLRQIIFGVSVSSIEDYIGDLHAASFTDVEATDMTQDWSAFASARAVAWRAGHTDYARVHGEAAYAAQEMFYDLIRRLYESGSLAGVRVTARAPLAPIASQ